MPALLEAVRNGRAQYEWATVESGHGGHFARFRMFVDAAAVDGVRLSCSAREAQQCADLLGAVLPTPRLLDLAYRQAAVRIEPQPQSPCTNSPAAVRRHSDAVGTASRGMPGLTAPVGKHWVLWQDAEPVNYGWHTPGPERFWRGIKTHPSVIDPELRVIQPPGRAHGLSHADYSQTLVLINSSCEVDGVRMPTARVYTDPDLCGLAVASGRPLRAPRYASVPVCAQPPDAHPSSPLGVATAAAGDALGVAAQRVAEAVEDIDV